MIAKFNRKAGTLAQILSTSQQHQLSFSGVHLQPISAKPGVKRGQGSLHMGYNGPELRFSAANQDLGIVGVLDDHLAQASANRLRCISMSVSPQGVLVMVAVMLDIRVLPVASTQQSRQAQPSQRRAPAQTRAPAQVQARAPAARLSQGAAPAQSQPCTRCLSRHHDQNVCPFRDQLCYRCQRTGHTHAAYQNRPVTTQRG